MIYIKEDQIDQIEYLIHQSIQGNHILFDLETVRQAFQQSFSEEEESANVEHHIEKLILKPSLNQKRAYLEKLDPDTLKKVIRTYFNIIENNLFEQSNNRH